MANTLVLVVPGLLALPPQALGGVRSLSTLARYAGAPRVDTRGIAGALFAALGIDAKTPVAPLALLGAGSDPHDDYVLRADPVHLAADRDRVVLVQTIDDLSADDAALLIRMLDRHFADDGLRFEAPRPNAWFARRRQPADIATTPPDAARGRDLISSMPRGPDSGTWKRWQNEIEMMLHEHPVNAAREAREAIAANAVWFSGGGRLADVRFVPRTFVTAAPSHLGDLAHGLARHAGTTSASADVDLRQAVTLAAQASGRGDVFTLAVVSPVANAQRLDANWLTPALELLAAQKIASLHLVADGHGAAVTWIARLPSVWHRLVARASSRTFEIPPPPDDA